MTISRSQLLRTTTVQAFARTLAAAQPGDARSTSGYPSVPPEPSSSTPSLPGVKDVVGGHYQLESMLGEGMFGKVYVARRLDVPEHRVALKLMPRALYAGRNVERELVMLATVGHPHVVQLKDHGTTPDYVWLTMPVYHGQTLAQRLELGTLTCRQAYDIFLPVARGLDALHDAGLRHQDVKPENIYLAQFGGRVHPILLDLGVAAEKDASFVAGTALYAAPEQVAALSGLPAAATPSEKMDTYGLACTLLYALVGPKYFPGETAADRGELGDAQEVRTVDPIDDNALLEVRGAARREMVASFKRWLAFDPEQRPTMKALCEQLDVLLEPEREEERIEEQKRARQKATLMRLWAASGALVLAVATGGVVAFQKRETLQIAAQLQQARREGAASFDKLDTCTASYRVASQETTACRTALSLERAELKRGLEDVMRSGSQTQAEHAHETQRYNNRIKACEDAAATQKRTCEDDAKRLASEGNRERAELTAERDAAKAASEQEKAGRATAEAERDVCRAETRALAEERDACKAAAKAAQAAPDPRPAGPRPGGSAVPTTSATPAAGEPTGPLDPKPPPVTLPPQPPAQAPAEPKAAPQGEIADPKGT